MKMDLYRKIEKARTQMTLSLPFIASTVMMLDMVEDSSVKTAETDGISIYYNPTFIENLTFRQLKWLLAHEALHCVLLHIFRVGFRDFKLWNIAADYVINLILDEIKEFEFIDGCLFDRKFNGLSTEEVYNLLNQLPQQKKEELKKSHSDAGGFRKPGDGKGKKSDSKDNKNPSTPDAKKSNKKGNTPSDKDNGQTPSKPDKNGQGSGGQQKQQPGKSLDSSDLQEKWQIFTKQAAAVSKKLGGTHAGMGSATLERLIERILNPTVPWTEVLYNFVDMTAREEYDWNRPNRRYAAYGYYLPSLYNEKLGFIVVAIDTSSSIRQADIDRFAAEVEAIKQAYQCKIMVIYCDTRVNPDAIQIFDEDEEVILRPSGGGGTDFRPPFNYLETAVLDEDVRCLIYFTDGFCNNYPLEPEYPVLWVGMREFTPRFGDFVLMESE